MRYVAEALRGQMTQAVARGATSGGPDAFPLSLAALRKELVALVQRTLDERGGGPPASAEQVGEDVVEALEDSMVSEAPGAALPPQARVVTGTRSLREIGFLHDVALCDPCLPKETWVTRCGWRFGRAEHVVYEQGTPTCPKCAICRRTGRGALYWKDKKRKASGL